MSEQNRVKTLIRIVVIALSGILIAFVFKNQLFSLNGIIGGDWPYFYPEQIKEFPLIPYSWSSSTNLGGPTVSPWIDSYLNSVVYLFVNKIGISWVLVQKIFFFFIPILLSAFSITILWRTLFKKFSLIPLFIYIFNTYFLMLYGGGQMGVVLAYSVAPLVLASFIKTINYSNFNKKIRAHPFGKLRVKIKNTIFTGLVLSFQMLFDPRITYITLIIVFLYVSTRIVQYIFYKNLEIVNTLCLILYTFVPIAIAVLLNFFWIFPLISDKSAFVNGLGASYTSSGVTRFLSFAFLENSFSLLQPNWPENLFGKVYFMRPEFIILPILAYSSLFFLKISNMQIKNQRLNNNLTIEQFNSKNILFFALLGLIGAFLAKGANEPFGELYLWLFNNIPGFNMFRDPTKWYLLIAISYSVLIPYSIWNIYEKIKSYAKFSIFNFQNLFLLLVICFLLFFIKPAISGQLTGTFKDHEIPQGYIKLKNVLSKDNRFYRTLWIPKFQRFGFYSNNHPAISSEEFFSTASVSGMLKQLNEPEVQKKLKETAIKYIIVPLDSESEIFLDDRRYNKKKYESIAHQLDKLHWLKKVNDFGQLEVYELNDFNDKFFILSSQKSNALKYKMINPALYELNIKNGKKDKDIIFSERYNKNWTLNDKNFSVESKPYKKIMNSFLLPHSGDYKVAVVYKPQEYAESGRLLSLAAILLIIALLFV